MPEVEVLKVAMATIDERTTFICLDVHGQVRRIDELFHCLNGDWDNPPFHFGCRTIMDIVVQEILARPGTEGALEELRRRRDELGEERFRRAAFREARARRPPVPGRPIEERKVFTQAARRTANRLVRRAEAVDAVLTDTLHQAARQSRGRLGGLQYRIKSRDSLARKLDSIVREEGISMAEAARGITDTNRYTVIWRTRDYAPRQAQFRATLEARGWQVMKDKNYWPTGNVYRGHNTVWRTPDGAFVEIQFHTPRSYFLKEKRVHPLYEEARLLPPGDPRRLELEEQMRRIWDMATPRNSLRFGDVLTDEEISFRAAVRRATDFLARQGIR